MLISPPFVLLNSSPPSCIGLSFLVRSLLHLHIATWYADIGPRPLEKGTVEIQAELVKQLDQLLDKLKEAS
jgi:hypothetical protein